MENKVNNVRCLATVGGTGAISLSINMCLNEGDSILVPEIAWGNYANICKEFNLNPIEYNPYDVDDLLNKVDEMDKVFMIINSPCENPCGCSYTYEQWKTIFDKLNSLNKEAIVLNDVAYMDYANAKDSKRYFELFNDLNSDVMVHMAYSCSKSFSYYGERLGALLVINNDIETLDSFENQCARHNRTIWSSVNNGAMINVANILNNHLDEYLKQKNESVELLKQRSSLFIEEANACGLEIYPYQEGFFVTVKVSDNNKRDQIHQTLMDNHIYTIKTNKGIRVGICAVPLNKLKGLALKIKNIISRYN